MKGQAGLQQRLQKNPSMAATHMKTTPSLGFRRAPFLALPSMPTVRCRSEASPRADPLHVLGQDVLSQVLRFLGPQDLLAASMVSRYWRQLANQDALWQPLCEEAWAGKVYVAAGQRGDLPWKRRYLCAAADASRTTLTAQELCTFRWSFRFKRGAGEFWLELDPYWNGSGGRGLERLFLPDGSIVAGHPDTDPLWGPHEIRWRFCKTQQGVRGHYVKVNHWPSLSISRSSDGGWVMQNMWVVYQAVLSPGGPYSRGIGPSQRAHLGSMPGSDETHALGS